MNNKQLIGLDLHEMNNEELANTSGGVPWFIPIGVGIALTQIFLHWDHFKEGLMGDPELVENQSSRRPILI